MAGRARIAGRSFRSGRGERATQTTGRVDPMYRRLGAFIADHWILVILGWIVLVAGLKTIAPRWDDVTQDGDLAYLPKRMTSVRGGEIMAEAFPNEKAKSQLVFVVRTPRRTADRRRQGRGARDRGAGSTASRKSSTSNWPDTGWGRFVRSISPRCTTPIRMNTSTNWSSGCTSTTSGASRPSMSAASSRVASMKRPARRRWSWYDCKTNSWRWAISRSSTLRSS